MSKRPDRFMVGFAREDTSVYGKNNAMDDMYVDPMTKKEADQSLEEMKTLNIGSRAKVVMYELVRVDD